MSPDALNDPALKRFFALVKEAGGEARAVGGYVRDSLLGVTGGDVDLATTLAPEAVMALCEQHGIKCVPTGLAHGTVTVVLNSKGVEVTTLRRDVETDGRHAVVAYTDRFEEDAARRDFTINTLYMDGQGAIYDFFGGQEDIKAQRLRFIGDATQRITEDGLRILRYFRFLATLGWQADATALAACAEKTSMLVALSGERIQQEMKKLLAAKNPVITLQHMIRCGIPAQLATGAWNLAHLPKLIALESEYEVAPNPWARLLLIAPDMSPEALAARWKLSNLDKKTTQTLRSFELAAEPSIKEALRHHPRALVIDGVLLSLARSESIVLPIKNDTDEACSESIPPPVRGRLGGGRNDPESSDKLRPHPNLPPTGEGVPAEQVTSANSNWNNYNNAQTLIKLAHTYPRQEFPITASDLLARGFVQGPELGKTLRALEQRWVESDYRLSKTELLTTL